MSLSRRHDLTSIKNIANVLQISPAPRRYKRVAIGLSALFDQVASILASGCNPNTWSIYMHGTPEISEEAFGYLWSDYVGKKSESDLIEWINRGGLMRQVHGEEHSFVVVRLLSHIKEHSCFGFSFDTNRGRKFLIVADGIARDPEALKVVFKKSGANLKLLTKQMTATSLRNAPCHLVLPRV